MLASSRPTAVNLLWALDQMRADPTPSGRGAIHVDEVERCRSMVAHAVELCSARGAGAHPLQRRRARDRRLRHCGRRDSRRLGAGWVEHVWVDETRPLLQGARLTAWELEQLGIPHAVIADSAAASRMAAGEVDLVVTGADRIAANGDTANKIGTYGLAVLARITGFRSSSSRRPRRSTRRHRRAPGSWSRSATGPR